MKQKINLQLIPDEVIVNQIYIVRGQKVMIDRDLAELYGVETKVLKQAVNRNRLRFPLDFMFEMNKTELENWRSQIVTSNSDRMGLRYAPFCFTEQGVAMLSSVLNSRRAIRANIQIIRIFTRFRQMFLDKAEMRLEIEKIKKKLDGHDKNLELVFNYLDDILKVKKRPIKRMKRIGFKIPKR